ncbi:hypothetical protein, partial [Helicobacter pylori]|uniref:hypothetical protein n=1 Tax=Helicobacter pylori TaxID=210 RepID=UPI0029663BEC
PKEKESKYKLDFDFDDKTTSPFAVMMGSYTNEERKKRLGVLFAPMSYGGRGFQFSLIVIHALSFMADLKHHSDHEWNTMIENRNVDECWFETFDHMDNTDLRLFCDILGAYAQGQEETLNLTKLWAEMLPTNKEEALFIAQLLCDGGINKYNLSCAGLGENLLKDIEVNLGLATHEEVDEYFDNLENEGEAENLES